MTTTPPKPRLRWYQYGLRSLFVLTVLVAIAGSWFAVKRQQVQRERAAVAAIREMGGWVQYDWELEPSGNPNAQPPGPAWLRAWLGDDFFTHVVCVYMAGETDTDAGLEHLKGMTQLQELYLPATKVTDAGLEYLAKLNQLTKLTLSYTQVTDAGLEHLKGLTHLEDLHLTETKVTDAGLEHLKGLTQLETLLLDETLVTDAGLAHLSGLTQLKTLVFYDTKVTPEGVKKLQQALPNCEIVR